MTSDRQKKYKEYLDRHIFVGLKNINTGFDAPGIFYFSESDFEKVLDRVQKFGLGITGIEPWQGGQFFAVITYEDSGMEKTNPNWYRDAFKYFKDLNEDLQYAASYFIPDNILNADT